MEDIKKLEEAFLEAPSRQKEKIILDFVFNYFKTLNMNSEFLQFFTSFDLSKPNQTTLYIQLKSIKQKLKDFDINILADS